MGVTSAHIPGSDEDTTDSIGIRGGTSGNVIADTTAGLKVDASGATVPTRDIITTNGQYRAQSVTTTAAEALGAATILTPRRVLSLLPTNGTIYWGYSNAVTTSTGTPVFKNQLITFAVSESVHIYVIAAGTVDCRISEGY